MRGLSLLQLTIKKGDTRNGIEAILIKNGKPADLTDCHVLFYMYKKVSEAHATVLNATEGKVLFPLENNIVNESGFFKAEFKVVYPDGRKETFPNNKYISIEIVDSLGG